MAASSPLPPVNSTLHNESLASNRAKFVVLTNALRRVGAQSAEAAAAHLGLGITLENADNFGPAVAAYADFVRAVMHAEDPAAHCLGLNSIAYAYELAGQWA